MESSSIAGPSIGLGQHVLFGAPGETLLHPAVAAALLVATILMAVLPRRYVVLPLLLLSIVMPLGQMVMIGPIHLHAFRILLAFAWLRLLWERYRRKERSSKLRITSIDKAVMWYGISFFVCYVLLWQAVGALISALGEMYNVIGFYFVFRFFVREREDVERVIKVMAVIATIVAACMLNEQITGRNLLSVFGAVPEDTAIRAGYLRSQGPFRVYLTAGAFGATLLPLFLCLWHKRGSRLLSSLGVMAALTIAITSRTSTAITGCVAFVIGLGMWVFRDQMRLIRWGIVSTLVMLHLTMKAPVWALIARIDFVGGSTGWHRYKIVDNFIRHFWDWWLLGSNNYWTWDGGDDMWDAANQYVAIGQTAGLLPLVFFLASIVYSFGCLGHARRAAADNSRRAWFFWLLGVALFSNVVVFFGISYFDQTRTYWYALVAMIVAAAAPPQKAAPVPPDLSAGEEFAPLRARGQA